jgi:hypothetical protein
LRGMKPERRRFSLILDRADVQVLGYRFKPLCEPQHVIDRVQRL